MAMEIEPAGACALAAPAAAERDWRRWLRPSLADCLFVSWIVWIFLVAPAGWDILLADGDTGWHIRTGEWILGTASVPRADFFSFSKPGAPWYAWEWLSDVIYAAAFAAGGLKGVVLLAGALIAAYGVLFLRYTLWKGAAAVAALPVSLLAFGASSVHFLARPHLFTWLLLVALLWLWERDSRTPDGWIWLLAPLMALWVNLHGGFVAGLVCLAVLAAGRAAELLLAGDRTGAWRAARRGAAIGAAAGAASLANPYGLELHRHLVAYLGADWIRNAVNEFRAPSFRTENVFQFELLLFAGLMAAAGAFRRRRLGQGALILLWAHAALVSARHIPIFVIVAAPTVAVEATRLWEALAVSRPRRSLLRLLDQMARDWTPGFDRVSVWPAVFLALLAAVGAPIAWPEDFPAAKFPVAMAARHAELLAGARLLADDDWADYLLFRNYPRQRVFFDGRSDFYGRELMGDYLAVINGRHDWEELLDRHGCEAVLVPAESPAASLLKRSAKWRLIDDDGQATLFLRRLSGPDLQERVSSTELITGAHGP
jgi:hypothetical protein